jgi:hypothetical protein
VCLVDAANKHDLGTNQREPTCRQKKHSTKHKLVSLIVASISAQLFVMRQYMWALLALMNYFDTEAEERNDPDTPAENEQDGSDSNHGDSAGNGNPGCRA